MLPVLLILVLPAILGAGVAWYFRARMRMMRFNIFAFTLIMGLLTPFLIGQLTALAMTNYVDNAMALAWPLMAGVSAGSSWFCFAVGYKLTGGGGEA